MPHNANELGTSSTAPAFNLNFGSEINSYTLTDYGGLNNSLFQKFYQKLIFKECLTLKQESLNLKQYYH